MKKLLFATLTLVLSTAANAALIHDTGSLTEDVTSVRTGHIDDFPRDFDGWTFSGVIGDLVTITVNRLSPEFDPYFELYEGDVTGLESNDISSIAFADDDIPEFLGYDGWFSDPQIVNFELTSTGMFTVAVACAACDFDGQGPTSVDYQITLGTPPTGPVDVPAPATILLLGFGAFFMFFRKRQLG